MAKTCEDFGDRKQLSVFFVRVPATDFVRLRTRLYDIIDLNADQVLFMWGSFADFFRAATAGPDPYPYQVRFAEAPTLPHLLRAPTGAGKTAAAVLGWLWRLQNPEPFPNTPRRLVYCLPMRVLVEQSADESRKWIDALVERGALKERIPVHVLMGGSDSGAWHLHPEKPAILIGTQDMLLSRALDRGYAATRFHWPIDFGLLNNDCLWVFDEPQLMANGVMKLEKVADIELPRKPEWLGW